MYDFIAALVVLNVVTNALTLFLITRQLKAEVARTDRYAAALLQTRSEGKAAATVFPKAVVVPADGRNRPGQVGLTGR